MQFQLYTDRCHYRFFVGPISQLTLGFNSHGYIHKSFIGYISPKHQNDIPEFIIFLVKSAFLWVKPGLRQVLGPELQEAVQRPLHGLVGRGQLINSWFTLNVQEGGSPDVPRFVAICRTCIRIYGLMIHFTSGVKDHRSQDRTRAIQFLIMTLRVRMKPCEDSVNIQKLSKSQAWAKQINFWCASNSDILPYMTVTMTSIILGILINHQCWFPQ